MTSRSGGSKFHPSWCLLAEAWPWQQGYVSQQGTKPPSHRPIGDWVLHAPQILRALVRADEIWLAILSAVVGVFSGLGVVVINAITQLMHERLFALPTGQGLSESLHIAPLRAFVVPVLGGTVLGVSMWALARLRPHNLVDPVEANALYGGRVSLNDSLIVAAQTAWSNGVGASVGMEAGYAQLGAGIASGWGAASGCGVTTCGCSSAAAPRRPSAAPSTPPYAAHFTVSN